jgi:hypothetical protein
MDSFMDELNRRGKELKLQGEHALSATSFPKRVTQLKRVYKKNKINSRHEGFQRRLCL